MYIGTHSSKKPPVRHYYSLNMRWKMRMRCPMTYLSRFFCVVVRHLREQMVRNVRIWCQSYIYTHGKKRKEKKRAEEIICFSSLIQPCIFARSLLKGKINFRSCATSRMPSFSRSFLIVRLLLSRRPLPLCFDPFQDTAARKNLRKQCHQVGFFQLQKMLRSSHAPLRL